MDQKLRTMGTYQCPATAIPRPTDELVSAVAARCYRDTIQVMDSTIGWTRTFYSSKSCEGASIGFGQWTADLKRPRQPMSEDILFADYRLGKKFTLVRGSPEWFYDATYECDLKKYAIGKSYEMRTIDKCRSLFPSTSSEGDIRFFYFGREAVNRIRIDRSSGASTACERT